MKFIYTIFIFTLFIFSSQAKLVGIVGANAEFGDAKNPLQIVLYKHSYFNKLKNICGNNINFIFLPLDIDQVEFYSNLIDGAILTGGPKNIDPKYYNGKIGKNIDNSTRIPFYLKLIKEMDRKNKSVFGICLGHQAMNVSRGGSLMYIEDEYVSHVNHNGKGSYKYVHDVDVKNKSILNKILNQKTINTNSEHDLAVKNLGKNLNAVAFSSDGIIEAIEDSSKKFFIGIQWHPEELDDENTMKIFQAFCNSL